MISLGIGYGVVDIAIRTQIEICYTSRLRKVRNNMRVHNPKVLRIEEA